MNRRGLIFIGGFCAALLIFAVAAGKTAAKRLIHRRAEPNVLADVAQAPAKPQPILKYHEPVAPKRLDAWTIIGPGGGGTFYNPAISPHDPKLVFVSTDMTGCYVSENGGLTWREFNLRFTCQIQFDPKLPNRVYAKAQGLWRSDDRGHTWSLVYPDPNLQPEIVYMDDEGETEVHYQKGGYPTALTSFAIDPDDSNRLYLTAPPDLLASADGGKHWKTLASNNVNGARLYVDPSSPVANRRLFVVGGNVTGVWDGQKYTLLKAPDNSTWFYGNAFGVRGDGKPVIYTANDYYVKNNVLMGGGILGTEDGGVTWKSANEGLLKLVAKGSYPEFSAVGTSLHHPEVIYVSFYHLMLPNDAKRYYGIAKTTDGGATWKIMVKDYDKTPENVHDSWIGQRFGPEFGDQPLNIGVDDNNPNLVYTTDLGAVMRSTDGGETWDAVYSQGAEHGYTTTGLDVTTCYGVHFDPFDQKRMFISYTDIGLFRSEDGGKSWISSIQQGVPRAWWNTTYWMEFDPAVKGKMWAVMSRTHDLPRMRMFRTPGSTAKLQGGVVMSLDGGNSWKPSSQGLPQMAATHILLDPKSPPNARVLYVTGFGKGIFKSTDGGQTWTAKNNGLPPTEPLTWRMAMDSKGTLYVVTIRRSEDGKAGTDKDGWLFRSRNGADTWERVPLPEGVNGPVGITVDPQDPARLYLATWGRYTLYAGAPSPQGGVYLSTDAGQHWQWALDRSRRIYDVTVDPKNPNIVYATGAEASAWRSTNKGKTWKRIRGFNFKAGHRIIPDPADPSKIYITTFGSSVWHGPAEGDPNAVEDIVAPLTMTFASSEHAEK
jgi:photosystem II stability/assembly factor-like uncharacterized protein